MDSVETLLICVTSKMAENMRIPVLLGNGERFGVQGKGMVKIKKFLNGEWHNASIN